MYSGKIAVPPGGGGIVIYCISVFIYRILSTQECLNASANARAFDILKGALSSNKLRYERFNSSCR
jgi:hypothetical protein